MTEQRGEVLPCLQALADGSLLLHLYVQPRAAANQLAGLHGDALRLRLTAPPVDGKANTAVIACLAKVLGLPKSAMNIESGRQSRTKILRIHGVDAGDLRQRLAGLLPPDPGTTA